MLKNKQEQLSPRQVAPAVLFENLNILNVEQAI